MIKGLEFLKSWRYWAWMIGSTGLMTLGMAGATIVSFRYFSPMADGSPDILYPILLGLPLSAVFIAAGWVVFGRGKETAPYPEKYRLRLLLTTMVSAQIVAYMGSFAVTRIIIDPILGDPDTFLFPLFSFMVGWNFGLLAGGREWARMTGALDAPSPESTPHSP